MKTESLKMITRMKFSYSFKDEKSSVCKTDLITRQMWYHNALRQFYPALWNSKYLAHNPISSQISGGQNKISGKIQQPIYKKTQIKTITLKYCC